jgi:hypothetical protein
MKPTGDASKDAAGYRGNVLVRRRGALRFPVELELIAADGTHDHMVWDAVATSERIPWHGKSPLVAAVIDPDHRVLLDDDLGNNARSTSTHPIWGRLLDRLTFDAEAFLTEVLP